MQNKTNFDESTNESLHNNLRLNQGKSKWMIKNWKLTHIWWDVAAGTW